MAEITQQNFGSTWTASKLNAVEEYLKAYTTALRGKFKLRYIDTFAGSGSITLKGGKTIDGSAIRALKYPFDGYLFIESDKSHCNTLTEKLAGTVKEKNITIINEDCNTFLSKIDTYNWNGYRAIIFIDPYAMDFSWETLVKISNIPVFDVWYFFPFMAINRNLYTDLSAMPEANKQQLNRIFGSEDWQTELYKESPQLTLFGNVDVEKSNTDEIRTYIVKRFGEIFPTVSPIAPILKNEKKSPQFMLCFMGSNPNKSAKKLSLRIADYILSHI